MNDNGKIIVFPEVEKLNYDIERLRSEISMLLLERDELRLVICRNIETDYMLALGSLEYQAYKLYCEILRIKRKIDIVQSVINNQQKIAMPEIDKKLDEEFYEYQKQLDEQINKINDALDHNKGKPLTEEETKEIKKTYRNIVKALHPDLNPDVTEAQIKLFHNAVLAYKNCDLNSLRVINEIITEPVKIEKTENVLIVLKKEKERLEETLQIIRNSIAQIKTEYPYIMKDLLDNPEEVEKKKAEIKKTIEDLKEVYNLYFEKLEEMLRGFNE